VTGRERSSTGPDSRTAREGKHIRYNCDAMFGELEEVRTQEDSRVLPAAASICRKFTAESSVDVEYEWS